MSINWVELNQLRQPLPIGEETFMGAGRLREVKAKISSPIPTQPGHEGSVSKGTDFEATGTAYLSDLRLVFVSNNSQAPTSTNSFSTFSLLFSSIVTTRYQQPWFGGNYIEVAFKPTPEGGLPVGAIATLQLRVDGGGLYEFCASLQHHVEAAKRKNQELNTLPVYTPPRSNVSVPTQSTTSTTAQTSLLDAPNELPPAYSI